jgi:hypothetical protein
LSGTVVDIVPGAAGTAGVATDLSKGDHQHHLVADPQASSLAGQANSTTTFADDPELQIAIPAAGTYKIDGLLVYQSAGGFKSQLVYTGTYTALHFAGVGPGTVDETTAVMSFNNNVPFVAVGSDYPVFIQGLLVATGTGTLKVQFAATAAGTAYRQPGSFIHAQRLY